jgi:acyl carrier protein
VTLSARSVSSGPDEGAIRGRVRELWAAVLASDGADPAEARPDVSFFDAGGTSLSALRLLGALHGEFGVRLSWSDIRAASDVDDLSTRVAAARAAER